MKKSLVSLIVGAGLAFSATAQDQSGSTESAFGGVTTGTIATGVVAVGVLGAVIANNRGSADIDDEVSGNGCKGDDELNADGFCVGTTDTVTGTATATTMTSVTITYAPAA